MDITDAAKGSPMTDREEARCANCDAFPLAVGLAQAKARIERIEAIAQQLADQLAAHACDCGQCTHALAEHTAYQIDGR